MLCSARECSTAAAVEKYPLVLFCNRISPLPPCFPSSLSLNKGLRVFYLWPALTIYPQKSYNLTSELVLTNLALLVRYDAKFYVSFKEGEAAQ